LPQPEARSRITWVFTILEDIVHIDLGILLAASALTLLVTGCISFVQDALSGTITERIPALLARLLLVLLVVELLYTVQVSFREHTLVPEPFLLIGLISAIRRVLVVTAEFSELRDTSEVVFQHFIIELGVLTVLIVALSLSLLLLRKRGTPVAAGR
jgi:hypothetical protein